MSDDENSELNLRFNKFECTSRNGSEPFRNNLGAKRRNSNELVFESSVKKMCSNLPNSSTSLNKSWSGNTRSVNISDTVSPITNYSANNRLKKLRDSLKTNPKNISTVTLTLMQNKSFELNVDELQTTYDHPNDVHCTSLINKVLGKEDQLISKVYECGNEKSTNQIFRTPTSCPSNFKKIENGSQQFISSTHSPTPVNIYKNLDKWLPETNKSSKRSLANERLQRLKKYVNNSDKDNIHISNKLDASLNGSVDQNEYSTPNFTLTSQKMDKNESSDNSHVSPLLRGLKRVAADINLPDCSSPKKIAMDTKPNIFYKQPRSMRLVQSALCQENLNNVELNVIKNTNSTAFATPISSKKPVSEKIIKLNDNSSPSSSKNKECFSLGDSTKQHAEKSTSFSFSIINDKPSNSSEPLLETDSSYQEKMKMTATWVESHCLISNKNYNPFSDILQTEKLSVKKSTMKPKEVSNEIEEMEWTNAEPDEEPSEDTDENKKYDKNETILEETIKEELTQKIEENYVEDVVHKDPDKSKALCIVVDTNIFINNLSKLKDVLDIKITGPIKPILYIPWMVVTELDYIKDSSSSNEKLNKDVMNSMKFINTALRDKNERILAQTVFDMQQQKQLGTSPDDKILSCCLFVKEKYESVILLSNDLNLKNKALIHGVEACSSNEIIMKIMSKLTKNVKYKKIHHKMSILCSSIICDCAKETYGETWKKMEMFSGPPWSLVECLKRFKKYWSAIFRDKLLKHCTKTLDDMLVWLKHNKYISDDSEEYVKFVQFCITLCIHLRDIEESSCAVQNTLNEITKIG